MPVILAFRRLTERLKRTEAYWGEYEGFLCSTHPLLHAGDNEPQVCAHLLLVCVLLLNALLEKEEAKEKV
jgi:hypothetical protein